MSALAATVATSSARVVFQGIGYVDSVAPQSFANAISADGKTVVGQVFGAFGYEAARWKQSTGVVGMGDFDPTNTVSGALDTSADGRHIVGFGFLAGNFNAFLWTASSGMQSLGTLQGGWRSVANAISANGLVVVGTSSVPGGQYAFRWSPGLSMMSLGDLNGFGDSEAFDVSGNGNVIVGTTRASAPYTYVGFRWTPSTGMVSLGDLPGGSVNCAAYGVSDDGSTIVGRGVSFQGPEAFVWRQSTGMIPLGDLPGGEFSSTALATNADGTVVVGESQTLMGPCAFIWTAERGMQELGTYLISEGVNTLEGWTLTTATDVSADGKTIVGIGWNPIGQYEGFVVKVGVPDARSVGGTVEFDGLLPGSPLAPRDAFFKLTPVGSSNVSALIHGFLNSDFQFVFDSPMPPGEFDVLLKLRNYLQKRITIDTTNGNAWHVSIPLIAGDVVEDNEVNLIDYIALVESFATIPGDERWNINADLNGDGEVNGFDLGLLAANFGLAGDE